MPEIRLDSKSLRILVIDDEEHIRFALTMCLETDGHKVAAAGTIDEALDQTARQAFDLIFLDVRLGTQNGLDYIHDILVENPWARIIVITAYASIDTAVEAMKRGATDYLPKPFEPAALTLLTQKVAERRLLERKFDALQKTLGSMDAEADFPTSSPIYRESIEFAHRVATANSPILIRGESGTGRGRLARAIHEWSSRARAHSLRSRLKDNRSIRWRLNFSARVPMPMARSEVSPFVTAERSYLMKSATSRCGCSTNCWP